MKLFLLCIFLLINFTGFSQRFKEVVLWQVKTKAKGLVFGISESKEIATSSIANFQKRNAGSKYDISVSKPIFKYTTFPIETRDENPVKNFKVLTNGKAYKVLSNDDLLTIQIAKEKGINAAVKYYMNKRSDAGRDFVTERIWNLVIKFDKFRINDAERYVYN